MTFLSKWLKWTNDMPSLDNLEPRIPIIPTPAVEPVKQAIKPLSAPPIALLWDTPQHAFHSTRVLCDNAELSVKDKNEICATIYGESEFYNGAICRNKDKQGNETSRDVGICQINSYWHCGKGKTFPSTEYVVAHPEKAVEFMISMFKAGKIDLWIAHKNKSYLKYLSTTSPMWLLKSKV